MEIVLNDINGQEKELYIRAPWEMVEEEYKDILKKYAKLPVKGFRPGNVPVGAIESFFKNEIKEDLASATFPRLCRKALAEKDTEAGTPLEISEIELAKNSHLKFKATFIEMPQFELPDYHHLNIEAKEEEEQLNEISLKLLEQTPLSLHPSFIEHELKYSDIPDEVTEADRAAAADRVKLMLVLKKIAHQDSIEVDNKDIEERITAIAEESEVSPDELRAYLLSNNGFSRLTDSLLAEQVLLYIIDTQE